MSFSEHFDFELNNQQTEAVEQIIEFSTSNNKVFILKGSAGTGKTTLVKGLCSYFETSGINIVLLATTGRAAKVLKSKTGVEASTIHSEIYVLKQISINDKGEQINKPTQNKKTELRFVLKQNLHSKNTIFLVDEASMISDRFAGNDSELIFGSGKLLQDIFRYMNENKIIFIGDHAQLPPIKTSFSAALYKNYIKTEFNIDSFEYILTKVERQGKNSGIINNATKFRDYITTNKYPKLNFDIKNYNDVFVLKNEFEVVNKYIKSLSKGGQDKNIFISLSNAVVNQVNTIVRRSLFPSSSELFVKDEKIMLANNNYKFNLLNGDIITFKKFTGNKIYNNYAKLTFIEIEFENTNNNKKITAYFIKEFLTAPKPVLTKQQNQALLINFAVRIKEEYGVKSTADPRFLDLFKNDPFLNALKLRYAYAVTCHKAQGGEWDNVFVAFEPYLYKISAEQRYRWIYTAITRAAKNLYINKPD